IWSTLFVVGQSHSKGGGLNPFEVYYKKVGKSSYFYHKNIAKLICLLYTRLQGLVFRASSCFQVHIQRTLSRKGNYWGHTRDTSLLDPIREYVSRLCTRGVTEMSTFLEANTTRVIHRFTTIWRI